MTKEQVSYIVKQDNTTSKCRLKHCFTLHYQGKDELCLECEEQEILMQEML